MLEKVTFQYNNSLYAVDLSQASDRNEALNISDVPTWYIVKLPNGEVVKLEKGNDNVYTPNPIDGPVANAVGKHDRFPESRLNAIRATN